MRCLRGRVLILMVLAISVMIFGAACDPNDTATQTAISQIADTMIVEGKTLFAPTDTPVPPTETPVPPTETPVPTEVKVGMIEEEGDCEVVDGSLGEDGCQIDLVSFYADPCAGDEMAFFEVGFGALPEAKTWDVCFTINSDNDPETGFHDDPVRGIDYVYCYGNEQQEIYFNRFETWGDYAGEIPVTDPWPYVAHSTEGEPLIDPFGMSFPPSDVPDLVLNDPYEVHAEGHYYNIETGDWVWDRIGPVYVPQCPGP